MRSTGRVIWRAAWLVGELCLVGLRFAFLYLSTFGRPNREQRAICLQRACCGLRRVFVNRVTMSGAVPQSGLLVSNHLSYLDIVLLGSLAPVVFVSKSEVRNWPVFGWFAALGGTVFVRRERRGEVGQIAGQIQQLLEQGRLIVLFPEGTSSGGETVLPFKSSLLEPMVGQTHRLHVGCVAYSIAQGTVSDDVCYWGDMVLAPHLLKLLGKPFVGARVTFAEVPQPASDRKSLAKQLHAEVVKLHEQLRQPRDA